MARFINNGRGVKAFWVLLLTTAWCFGAYAKPNFSGTWKLNVEKSEYGPMPAPTSMVDKIAHEDPSLKINRTQVGQQGELNYDLNFTTDGKESSNTIRGNAMKSTVNWEGETLVFDTKFSIQDNEITFKDKWNVSPDGKTITINRHAASPQGEIDQKLVMEKQ